MRMDNGGRWRGKEVEVNHTIAILNVLVVVDYGPSGNWLSEPKGSSAPSDGGYSDIVPGTVRMVLIVPK